MELVSQDEAGIDLRATFRAMRDSILWGVLGALIGGFVFFAILSDSEQQYRTETSVMISSPSRNEATVEQLAVQARAFGEIVNDDEVKSRIEEATGIPVNPVGETPNVKVTAPEDMPGVLDVTTEADSREKSAELADAVVAEVQGRAQTVRDQALGDFERAYQGLIDDLEQKRRDAAAAAPLVDLSRYDTALNELRAQQQQPRLNHLTVSLLSQETETAEEVEKRPLLMSVVLGIVLGLLVFALSTVVKLFFPRRVNEVWLRTIAGRSGVDVEFADSSSEFAPRTSALMTALRGRGERVLILESELPADTGQREDGGFTVRGLEEAWWEDADAHNVALAVLPIHRGAKVTTVVERNLDVLASLGIPARLSCKRR